MYDIRNLDIWKKQSDSRPRNEYLKADLTELNLSVRSFNCLKRAGCSTVGDIVSLIENDEGGLRRIRNLGSRSEAEILENVQQYREHFRGRSREQYEELRGQAGAQSGEEEICGDGAPIVKRALIRPEKRIWDCEIEKFHLSEYALSRLRQSGIRRFRDLYATNPKQEPGWYAVRELFEKIPSV